MYRIYNMYQGQSRAITAFEPSIPPCLTLHAGLHGIWHGFWVQTRRLLAPTQWSRKLRGMARHGLTVNGCWPLMDVNTIEIRTSSRLCFGFPTCYRNQEWEPGALQMQGMLWFCGGCKFFLSPLQKSIHMIPRFWCDLFLALIVWIPLDFHSLKPEQW